MNNDERDLLLKSLDSELSAKENQKLEDALKRSEDLRREREIFLNMRSSLKSAAVRSFREGFEERVMAKIRAKHDEDFTAGLFRIFRPVAIAAILLIIITASFNMWNSDQISVDGILSITDISPTDAFNPLVDLAQE
jgi:anti-sigma factor RsiW